jgi:predicted dehydrogenase
MIGLGVVGCGDVAMRTYLPGFAAIAERARVVACFDPDAGRAERFAARAASVGSPGARAYADLADFLAHPGLDAVFDLAPAPFHFATNRAILDAGKHCFSEKPIAGSVADGRALTDLARERGLVLLVAPAVMATNRFEWLKRESAAGRFGRLTLATGQMANMGPAAWREYNGDPAVFYGPEVGPLLDTGVYILHAMTGLLGPARRVEAFGGVAIPERRILIPSRYGETIAVGTNDHMLVQLDFGNATFAQLLSSFATPRSKAPAFELHGETGTVSIAQQVWYDVNAPIDLWLRDERLGAQEAWIEAAPPEPSPVAHLIQAGPVHFVDCIERRVAPILTGEQATHVLDIILSAARSVAEGRAIELETGA